MKKNILSSATVVMLLLCGQTFASPLVTSDVPLHSEHYEYIEKLEGMGFITDMPTSYKPYSRLTIARMLAKVNPKGMPSYLKVYYDEMIRAYSDEIAFVIQHEQLFNQKIVGSKKKQAKFHKEYYAHQHNSLVADKLELAKSEHFPCNVTLRDMSVEFSVQNQDRRDYSYKRTNATYQPLHGQNQGYRYGDGFNSIGLFTISGSVDNNLALGLTPRFSYDKDAKGKISLAEGYAKTHIGNLSITAGKQALNWGAPSRSAALSLSDNGPSHTYVKLGLLDPIKIEDGFFRFLGEINFQVFWSKLENNRKKQNYSFLAPNLESNNGNLVGMRLDITPNDTFTMGLQRIGMVSKFGKNWFWTTNDGVTDDNKDYGNDQAGLDWRWKFPGVQIYGAIYGEDGTFDIGTGFISNKSQYYGLYFPQLSKDGSWDLRIEHKKNSKAWYTHGGCFSNGWTYHGDIMGDPMGNRATSQMVEINNYLRNGNSFSFRFLNMSQEKFMSDNQKIREYQISYTHRLKENLLMDIAVGLADIKNAEHEKDKNEKAKYLAVDFKWNF